MILLAVAAYLAVGIAVAGFLDVIGATNDPGVDVITVALWPAAVVAFAVGLIRGLVGK